MSKKWTPEEDKQLIEMYASNTPTSAITKLIGRSRGAIKDHARRLGITDPERQQIITKQQRRDTTRDAYRYGYEQRRKNKPKHPPSRLTPIDRAFWLAGWHDKDIELGNSVIAGRAA